MKAELYMCIHGGSIDRMEFPCESMAVRYFTEAYMNSWESISVWDEEAECWLSVAENKH